MIHICSMDDLEAIRDDPELYREVASYLLYCQYELREYDDDPDFQDVSFSVFQNGDPPMLDGLGAPEETVQIRIECCGEIRMFRRLVYPAEIILIDESQQ